jgi:hypothetical protein
MVLLALGLHKRMFSNFELSKSGRARQNAPEFSISASLPLQYTTKFPHEAQRSRYFLMAGSGAKHTLGTYEEHMTSYPVTL